MSEGAGRPPDGDDRGGRTDPWLLGAILALQVGLMVMAFVPAPHTGGDNAGYLGLAYSLASRGEYLDLYLPGEPIHTKYPPVFAGLLAGAYLLGARTWVAFKAVPALATTAAVALSYLWVRERRGPAFAAVVAFLVAASSAVVYYSHWILSDPPFVALTLLALWALARSRRSAGEEGGLRASWLVLGCGAAIAAYFTRSAGLPLVAAVALWLGLRRRWIPLAGFGAAFGLPALLWWLRGRGAPGEGSYLAEFWLRDPYRPELGRAGPAEFAVRAGRNAWGYVSQHIPGGIGGFGGPGGTAVGVLLVVAAWGWLRWTRERPGPAELFVPLYLGLILLWPEVWSGDRFALPLIPLLLFYAGDGAVRAVRDLHPRASAGVAVAGLLFLGLPALASWAGEVRSASACLSAARTGGPWACTGRGMAEFAAAARWSGERVPEGSVVISRKPRIFYVLSGVKSQIFPLSRDPEAFFGEARELDARYLVFDALDNLSRAYTAAVIQARPAAFCPLARFGDRGGSSTRLLGILPERGEEARPGGERARLSRCPEGLTRGEPRSLPPYSSFRVPLFSGSPP